jgi:TB2/DP1, HVA22 family
MCSYAAGVAYPVYASFQTLEGDGAQKEQRTEQWLTYWTIYGSFTVVEGCIRNILSWHAFCSQRLHSLGTLTISADGTVICLSHRLSICLPFPLAIPGPPVGLVGSSVSLSVSQYVGTAAWWVASDRPGGGDPPIPQVSLVLPRQAGLPPVAATPVVSGRAAPVPRVPAAVAGDVQAAGGCLAPGAGAVAGALRALRGPGRMPRMVPYITETTRIHLVLIGALRALCGPGRMPRIVPYITETNRINLVLFGVLHALCGPRRMPRIVPLPAVDEKRGRSSGSRLMKTHCRWGLPRQLIPHY